MKHTSQRGRTSLPVQHRMFRLLIAGLLLALPGQAFSQVTAAYQHLGGGREITIRIDVGSPPPSSLILVQKLPPGTGIKHAEPPVEKFSPSKGEAKWFFRNPGAGTIQVSMTLDREVAPGEISGQVRFKPLQGGGMESMPVSRP